MTSGVLLVSAVLLCVISSLSSISTDFASNNGFNERDPKQEEYDTKRDDDKNILLENLDVDNYIGDPVLDYPTYRQIPRTGFTCSDKVNFNYYADIETECQVFHLCETSYSKVSFLCPVGSVFNQRHLVCDWWYNVKCNEAEHLYTWPNDGNDADLSELDGTPQGETGEGDRSGFDLSLASSGGNHSPNTSRGGKGDTSRDASKNQSAQDEKKYQSKNTNVRDGRN